MNLTETDFAYAAGLLDGEGYIAAVASPTKSRGRTISTKGKPYIHCDSRISIAMTSKEPLDWMNQKFGGTVYGKKQPGVWKDQWTWIAMGNDKKVVLLEGVVPFLKVKKQQAILLLEFVRMYGANNNEKRIELAKLCKELNRKGKTVTTNTPNTAPAVKIESELTGDCERASVVTRETAMLADLNTR